MWPPHWSSAPPCGSWLVGLCRIIAGRPCPLEPRGHGTKWRGEPGNFESSRCKIFDSFPPVLVKNTSKRLALSTIQISPFGEWKLVSTYTRRLMLESVISLTHPTPGLFRQPVRGREMGPWGTGQSWSIAEAGTAGRGGGLARSVGAAPRAGRRLTTGAGLCRWQTGFMFD